MPVQKKKRPKGRGRITKPLFERLGWKRNIAMGLVLAIALVSFSACSDDDILGHGFGETAVESGGQLQRPQEEPGSDGFDPSRIPAYDGSPYVVVNDNVPTVGKGGVPVQDEFYAPLDALGRCGAAVAVVSPSTMPGEDEERSPIGMVKPTGWHTVRYDDLVDGRYLYNRCHLVGWQLTGENDNERNLITGTRYMNTEGMLPFEDQVADYVDRTGGCVLYRVEPVFSGAELVARGVHMEAYSIDDAGMSVAFNVFVHNIQPGVSIDYATGKSWREEESGDSAATNREAAYVVNANTGKFHYPECDSVDEMSERNKRLTSLDRDGLVAQGYEPCDRCAS